MITPFEQRLIRGQREHGDKFATDDLHARFIPYYNSGQRIKVRYGGEDGPTITGVVSTTTGWKPAFILMRRSNDHGSSWVLTERDEIIAVQFGRNYVPVANIYQRP